MIKDTKIYKTINMTSVEDKNCNIVLDTKTFKGLTMPVLDEGFVKVVDLMGDDAAVVQAARVSYGAGTKTVREDKGLINYLMKQNHTSPFEMCEIKLHIKAPMFVKNQWVRHRTASINEYSARYSEVKDEIFTPEQWRGQSKTNKQCSEGVIDIPQDLQEKIEKHDKETYALYQKLLSQGVSRELARTKLDVGYYTEFYWKIDLHNLLHFIRLRMHPHAQEEIRVYAEAIAGIVKEWCPFVWEAFEEHKLYSKTLSRGQQAVLKQCIGKSKTEVWDIIEKSPLHKRDKQELLDLCL